MPRRTKREKELDALHERLDRQRRAMARKTARETAALLTNPDGLARLRAISDEEWQEAEAKGTDDAA